MRIAVPSGPPAGARLIWIMGSDGKLSAYGATDFRMWIGNLSLPADAPKHPENIAISRTGIVLYADVVPGTHLRHLWSTNNYAHEVIGGAQDLRPAKGGGYVETSATPDVYFSADGSRFFWFENRNTFVMRSPGGDVSREGAFLGWTTDLQGTDPQPVARFDFSTCKCETGACSETCPEISAWAPLGGVSDFFFATKWVPGQIDSQLIETDRYQVVNGTWTAQKLDAPEEGFLDAADHGNAYITGSGNGACGGAVNGGGGKTEVVRGGQRTTIFDERARFHNADYEVAFVTSKALFSPDLAQVAYTITSTAMPGDKLELSEGGKADPEELRQIQAALPELPRLEVVALADPSKIRASVPHSELIAWRDAQHLFALQNGQIVVVDVTNGQVTSTPLKAEKDAYVFVQ